MPDWLGNIQGQGCFTLNHGMLHLSPSHNLPSRTGHPLWTPCLQTGRGVVTPSSFRSQAVFLRWNRSKCIWRNALRGEDLQSTIIFTSSMMGKYCLGQVLGERWVSSAGTSSVHQHHSPLQHHPYQYPTAPKHLTPQVYGLVQTCIFVASHRLLHLKNTGTLQLGSSSNSI